MELKYFAVISIFKISLLYHTIGIDYCLSTLRTLKSTHTLLKCKNAEKKFFKLFFLKNSRFCRKRNTRISNEIAFKLIYETG